MWESILKWWRAGFVTLVLGTSAQAAVLQQVAVDYGTPGNAFEGALTAGQTGRIFLTLNNSGIDPLVNVTLRSVAGSCVDQVSESFVIENLAPKASLRFPTALEVSLNPSCKKNDIVEILLFGSHTNGVGRDEAVWAQVSFLIEPSAVAEFRMSQIHLELPDEATVEYPFDITTSLRIGTVAVEIGVSHSYHPDLAIVLIHPDGQEIALTSSLNGSIAEFSSDPSSVSYVSDLRQIIGKMSSGRWKLRVVDQAAGDAGYLEDVRVTLRP